MEEKVVHAIQDDYADESSLCYGCGRLNKAGLQLRTGWQEDKTITIYTPRPEHTGGYASFIYGGLIASIIDCHGTGSASMALHRENGHEPGDKIDPPRFVTASLKVDYLKPTPYGVPLKTIGTLENIHPKRWKIHTKVFANDILCAKGEVEAVLKPDTFV